MRSPSHNNATRLFVLIVGTCDLNTAMPHRTTTPPQPYTEKSCRAIVLGLTLCIVVGTAAGLPAASPARSPRGPIEFDKVSEFSHIRVRRLKTVRTLIFVRDNGDEAEESMVDVKKPYVLLEPYSKYMFTSYLFQPKPERVLIIGLGGGAMVHFLQHYDPQLRVDAVEIDPAVVSVADKYFECRSGGNINILTADGFKFLETTESRYDVIYMDAFLKPTAETDPTGLALRMKTEQFYRQIQSKLRPDGLVVFNLNLHQTTNDDLQTIRRVFAQAYVFRPVTPNYVVVASSAAERLSPAELKVRARDTDGRFHATFSYQELLKRLLP